MLRACPVLVWLGSAVGLALALALAPGCKYEFTPPAPPDLYKVPNHYDLGDEADRDLSVLVPKNKDMAGDHPDLAKPPVVDLSHPTDGG